MPRIKYTSSKELDPVEEADLDDPGDVDDDAPPPFDAYKRFPKLQSLRESMKEAKKVDSSVEDALGDVLADDFEGQEKLEALDAYFKGVWLKHHG